MKILSVSDVVVPELSEHFDSERFKGVELVISCGDLPPEYLSTLQERLDAPLFYVKGNHDIRYETTPPRGCVNLHRRLVRFKGFRIIGLEGSRWYNGGPNQYRESQMRYMVWLLMPSIWLNNGVDLVVSHAPPRHVHDAEDPCHQGFECFVKLIKRAAPRNFIHGHIHRTFEDDSHRTTLVGQTRVTNTFGYTLFEVNHG